MTKFEIVAALKEIAQLLKLESSDPYRTRAYAKAAQALAEFGGDLNEMINKKRLTEISGIGQSLAGVIEELSQTGRSSLLEKLRADVPPGALVLSQLSGLNLKRIQTLNKALGITSIDELKDAIEAGQLRGLSGFGEKSESLLLEQISKHELQDQEMLLLHALRAAERVVDYLKSYSAFAQIDIAGAIRRWKETVSEISITAAISKGDEALIAHFVSYPSIVEVISQGKNAATVRLIEGITVRLSVATTTNYSNLLLHETGSSAHLKRLDAIAKKKNILFSSTKLTAPGKRTSLKIKTEGDIYRHLGMQYVPPELREDSGEIEAALKGDIPDDLITIDDIQGMTHCHSTYSDGRNTIEEMARAAQAMGMKYMTLTDHSPTAHYANGVQVDRLKRQWDELERVQERVSIKLLRGTESDILRDGSLDYPDRILEQFDVIIASIHNRYKLDEDEMTSRLINAMRNPLFKVWGHPMGRLVQRRPPIACRVEEILDAIAESGAAIEISGDPHRLDMEPRWTREARKRNIRFVISTDAHSTSDLENLKFGIGLARRAGVRRGEVLNSMGARDFMNTVRPAGPAHAE